MCDREGSAQNTSRKTL
uniref:Uncharacterized protein n=1 Tax=Anguilla anguilla TaxID=7936 RepID=A0A0E9S0B4_ANGAN